MNDKRNFDYKRLHPFKWYILENYPFLEDSIDALNNYELFCKLGKMYNKQVDAINTLGVEVEGITDWFDDLDVQEEINNKLDEMAESGELEEIIASYLNTKALICFDKVADMKISENLIDGSYAKTLGYNNISDKGGAIYKIREITNEDSVDEKKIISITSTNNLVAELIYGDKIYVEQLGAIENEDITNIIEYAADNFSVPILLQNDYDLDDNITLNNKILDLNNYTITGTHVINITSGGKLQNGKLNGTKVNLISGKNTCKGITFIDWSGNALTIQNGAYESEINNIRLQNDTTNGAIGINCLASDNYFSDIYGYGAYLGIYVDGSNNYFENVHLWLNNNNEFTDSIFTSINKTFNYFINCCSDSYQKAINLASGYLRLTFDNFSFMNNNILFNNKTFSLFSGTLMNQTILGNITCKLTGFSEASNIFNVVLKSKYHLEILDGSASDYTSRLSHLILRNLINNSDVSVAEGSYIDFNDGKLNANIICYISGAATTSIEIPLSSLIPNLGLYTRIATPALFDNYSVLGVSETILNNNVITISKMNRSGGTNLSQVELNFALSL